LAVGALLSTLGACVTVMVMILVEDAKCAAKEVNGMLLQKIICIITNQQSSYQKL
jgi:hypothetical protein